MATSLRPNWRGRWRSRWGPSLARVAATARRLGLALVCPDPERALVGEEERFFDAIALFGPDGDLLRNTAKPISRDPMKSAAGAPGMRWRGEGSPFTVQSVHGLRVGWLKCDEAEFPELHRRLALLGAQRVVIPPRMPGLVSTTSDPRIGLIPMSAAPWCPPTPLRTSVFWPMPTVAARKP